MYSTVTKILVPLENWSYGGPNFSGELVLWGDKNFRENGPTEVYGFIVLKKSNCDLMMEDENEGNPDLYMMYTST